MNKRQLAAMAAAAMMLICMPTTAFAALGRPGQPSASVQQQVKSERKVIKKNVKETEEETAKWQQQMLESVNKERKAAGLADQLFLVGRKHQRGAGHRRLHHEVLDGLQRAQGKHPGRKL